MRKGTALLMVIFLFAVFTVLAALFVKIVYNCHAGASAAFLREQAFYLAEAGLEKAKVELAHNPNWHTDLPCYLEDNTEWLINDALGQRTNLGNGSFKTVRELGKARLYSIGFMDKGVVVLKLKFSTLPFNALEWKEL